MTDNNRVLGWKDAATFTNGAAADLVIGQPDFLSAFCNGVSGTRSASSLCDPDGVAVDGAGNLYVADESNNRVLEYTNPFTACGGNIPVRGRSGQPGLWPGRELHVEDCNNGGISADSLCDPEGVAVDGAGNLYVADEENSRVLEYNTPLTTEHHRRYGLWPRRQLHVEWLQ